MSKTCQPCNCLEASGLSRLSDQGKTALKTFALKANSKIQNIPNSGYSWTLPKTRIRDLGKNIGQKRNPITNSAVLNQLRMNLNEVSWIFIADVDVLMLNWILRTDIY